MTRSSITTDNLPALVGPFSLGVRGGDLLFLTGQVAQDPPTGALIEGDVARQAEQILRNIAAALEAVSKDLGDVVRVGVYLTGTADYAAVNEGYQKHFTPPYPARTAICVKAPPLVPAVGVDEDPATGPACAALVTSLAGRSSVRDGCYQLLGGQGVGVGRRSLIEAAAWTEHGRVTGVSVGGTATIMGRGVMTIR